MNRYFAWYTYDLVRDGRFVATVSTDEACYYKGHVANAQPSPVALAALQVALFNAVLQRTVALGIPYPGNAAVLANSKLRIRSEKS